MRSGVLLALLLSLAACCLPVQPPVVTPEDLARGQQLSFQRDKGNCLACHRIATGEDPGNIGPELVNIQTKFTHKAALQKFIWDATVFNPRTSMPPFGKHDILNAEELELVVAYIWTL